MAKQRFATDLVELCPSIADPAPIADPTYPYLRHAAMVGPAAELRGIPSWESFLDRGNAVSDALLDAVIAQVHPSDAALIVYSSGTTDSPKGVLHCHEAIARQWRTQAQLFGRDEFRRVWCPLPLFWTAGLNAAMGATIAGGATWVMQEMFEPGEALRLLERERVTEPHVFAHHARTLEEHEDWLSTDLSACTEVFGKSVFTRHPSVNGDRSWNMPVGYGMSETASFFTGLPWTTPREVFRNGSYGKLLPGNELRVLDAETGEVLGAGHQGELIVRGPTLMEHYVKRTRSESLDVDGWYHTGDLGHFDAAGYVYFGGRRTEMIKTAGANISPAEIEVVLQAFEPIKLSRVVGVPDERRDEIAVLCVTLKDGATTSEEAITAYLRERVASYKVPKQILFFGDDEIPMNATGTKVLKDRLLVIVQERLTP
jgi:fatty-acyl-CoA synthase